MLAGSLVDPLPSPYGIPLIGIPLIDSPAPLYATPTLHPCCPYPTPLLPLSYPIAAPTPPLCHPYPAPLASALLMT